MLCNHKVFRSLLPVLLAVSPACDDSEGTPGGTDIGASTGDTPDDDGTGSAGTSTSGASATTDAPTTEGPTTATTEPDETSDGTSTGGDDTGGEDDTGDTSDDVLPPAPRVWVATLDDDTDTFEVTDAFGLSPGPADIDWSTFGLLHDGGLQRLYFLSADGDSVYQFGFNGGSDTFEFGFESIDNLPLVGTPGDADASSFGMAYAGGYALYMLSDDRRTAYGFGYDGGLDVYSHGFDVPGSTSIEGAPDGVDWNGWAIAGSGSSTTLYAFASEDHDALVQFERSGNAFALVDAQLNLDLAGLEGSPSTDFAVVRDGASTRLYFVEVD